MPSRLRSFLSAPQSDPLDGANLMARQDFQSRRIPRKPNAARRRNSVRKRTVLIHRKLSVHVRRRMHGLPLTQKIYVLAI